MRLLKYLLLISTLISATPSLALFDAQLLAGYRNTTFKLNAPQVGVDNTKVDATAPTLAVAFHFNIPLIPIALGLSYNYVNLSADSNDLDIDNIIGDELGAEIYAWLPFGDFQPYVKLGYVFLGKYDIPLNGFDVNYNVDGFYGFLGLKYSFIPLFKILLEGGMPANGSSDVSVSNNSFSPGSDFLKISAWSVRLGLEVGI